MASKCDTCKCDKGMLVLKCLLSFPSERKSSKSASIFSTQSFSLPVIQFFS